MVRQRKVATSAVEAAPGLEVMKTDELVNISDYCKAQKLSEQSFRLVLESIHPDDFDTVQNISTASLEYVLSAFTATPAATNNHLEIAGNQATQALESTTAENNNTNQLENAQTQATQALETNVAITANSGNAGLSQNQQVNQGSNITLLDELIAASEEEIKLADLVSQFKNQQIIQNQQARDVQLIGIIRDQRLNTREGYLGALRDLQATTIDKPELTPDTLDFEAEITRLGNELGKQLVING